MDCFHDLRTACTVYGLLVRLLDCFCCSCGLLALLLGIIRLLALLTRLLVWTAFRFALLPRTASGIEGLLFATCTALSDCLHCCWTACGLLLLLMWTAFRVALLTGLLVWNAFRFALVPRTASGSDGLRFGFNAISVTACMCYGLLLWTASMADGLFL